MNWIKIEDQLPKSEDWFYQVLVYRMHSPVGSHVYEVACWDDGKFFDNNEDEIDVNLITHWAYIPKVKYEYELD